MAKPKSIYVCTECGYKSPRWVGKCPDCEEWNTISEEAVILKGKSGFTNTSANTLNAKNTPLPLSAIKTINDVRTKTGISELDRVLSGGIVNGSLTLIAGDPGIGKSTLLLQMCDKIGITNKILYVSGEESAAQIKMRADRLNISTENLHVLAETNIETVVSALGEYSFLFIDSVQTMQTDSITGVAGSVTQVKQCASLMMRIAKENNIAVILVGHATKEGTIAGPKILEHMVDTVLYFEGERYLLYRILRAVKNRFGSINEIGIFEMKENGLNEILNPSEYMLAGRTTNLSGSVATPLMEGTRPIVTEVQSLVTSTTFPMPKRSAIGMDYNRVMLLVAVLEKRLGLKLAMHDVYVNIAGGIKVTETAVDTAVIAAILSSYRNKPVDSKTAFFGEVGLSGEIRAVSYAEKRVIEASKLGFSRCVIPFENTKGFKSGKKYQSDIIGVSNVTELFDTFI